MNKIFALIAAALLSLSAQAEIVPAKVTGGPTSAHPLPEAHKRMIREQQKKDDQHLMEELATQKKAGKIRDR